jgi:hypothetical protein
LVIAIDRNDWQSRANASLRYASAPLLAASLLTMSRHAALTLILSGIFACNLTHAADKPTGAQRKAAEEFLAAVSTGDPQAVAFAIHPTEIDALRARLLTQMRDEATRKDNTIRARLFGPAMPLADLERLTGVGFYTLLGRRLSLGGREYQSVEGLVAIPDKDGAVLVVVRGKPPRERGTVSTVRVVSVKPYGKDWKATIPAEIEAQIEDLSKGRRGLAPPAPSPASAPNAATAPAESGVPPAINELLSSAEKALTDGKCDEYYDRFMSPNFRRVTAKKAREALIASCQRGGASREMLLSALRIVRGLTPKFEYEGARAVYDLSGQGLPYDRFVLEQVDKKWYIAE